MPRPLTLFLGERGIWLTGWRYLALVATLTIVVSLPFVVAVVLAVERNRKEPIAPRDDRPLAPCRGRLGSGADARIITRWTA